MLTEQEFELWCKHLNILPATQSLIAEIRAAEPARRVKSGVGNVSGRYPSRKMGCTIQFESHRNELATILELEHDPTIREYYDQPPAIKLNYRSKSGKALGVLHTPDFFILHNEGAGWIECKTEKDLVRLAATQPTRYLRDERGRWRCRPGEEYALPRGLSYRLKSSAEIDWRFQRNVLFLEDYLRADELAICEETVVCFQSLVAAHPGITLADLLSFAAQHDLASDLIYILLVTDRLYLDLTSCILVEPERARVFYDEPTARRYGNGTIALAGRQQNIKIDAGRRIVWDGNGWEIVNPGETTVWLRDDAQQVISLSRSSMNELIRQGRIIAAPEELRAEERTQFESIRQLLAAADPEDLAEANRRYRILSASTGRPQAEQTISVRTMQRWSAAYQN